MIRVRRNKFNRFSSSLDVILNPSVSFTLLLDGWMDGAAYRSKEIILFLSEADFWI